MTIIKVSNNRIRFEHPIVLDTDKKYRIVVSHLIFSIHQTFHIQDFRFDIEIPIPITKEKYVSRNAVTGSYGIKPFEKELQTMFNVAYSRLIEKMKNEKKDEIIKKLKSASSTPEFKKLLISMY